MYILPSLKFSPSFCINEAEKNFKELKLSIILVLLSGFDWIFFENITQIKNIKTNKNLITLESKYDSILSYERIRNQDFFLLKKNDMIYLFSDGYQDQFGGERNKKFMISKLKKLLLKISNENVDTQLQKLKTEFELWKGNEEQIDDVCLMGVRII